MNNFYIETESTLFCLLIVVFLYVFRSENLQFQTRKNKFTYYCLFAVSLFSVIGDFMQNAIVQNLCFAACGLSSFGAAYFYCECVADVVKINTTPLNKILVSIACAVFGFLSFYLLKRGINAPIFVLVFFVAVLFVVEQHNKIRVDNLTKLYNRYGMDAELKEQLRQYERENSDSFYIIACDLDNFKHINDTWGHQEGDRALVLVAGALSKVGKKFDAEVFRIGGDEFVIITDTSEEGLAADIEKAIKSEFDDIEFRDDFDIKISIGSALYDGVTDIDELLNNADKKLYEAKKRK